MDGEQMLSVFSGDTTPWTPTQSECGMSVVAPSVTD